MAVLDQGRIVETGPTGLVLADPRHACTRELLAAVPVADPAPPRLAARTQARQRNSLVRPLRWEVPALRNKSLPDERLVAAD